MAAARPRHGGGVPTVLLVHDAFTTTYCWTGTIEAAGQLRGEVLAVSNPLRGLASDAAYLTALFAAIDGPVVLVGHGYGGGVITAAAAGAANVVALVYVAAFALAEDESCVDVVLRAGGDRFVNALVPTHPHPDGRAGTELYLRRDAFAEVYCADLPPGVAAALAASQVPVAADALAQRPLAAAWRGLPCWYLVATADRVIDVAVQRAMAARAGAVTVEVEVSHAVPMSAPEAVADLIRTAVTAVTEGDV